MSQRPVVNPDPLPHIRTVPTGNALEWIRIGVMLFKAYPLMWGILMTLFFAVMYLLTIVLVPVGILFFALVAQVFLGGLMIGCRDVERQQELEINHLFAGFKAEKSLLVKLGFYFIATLFLLGMLASGLIGPDLDKFAGLTPGQQLTPEQVQVLSKPLFVMGCLYIPVIMAFRYAAALVALNGLHPWHAIKLSFMACLKNILPLLFYGFLIGLFYLVLATITLLFGKFGGLVLLAILLFSLIPVMITSLYISYRDIFITASND